MSDLVLIVDDERGIRETLRAVLEDEGFECEAVASGEECLKAVERRAFGCVLLDVWLTGIDGLETLTRIRGQGTDTAVVMISGHATIETAVRATKLGAFDFIEKPLSIEKTVLTVRNALRQRELERTNAALKEELRDEWAMVGESWRCVRSASRSSWSRRPTDVCSSTASRGRARSWSRAPSTRARFAPPRLSSS
jgi:two-component system nitrogen regulation response regulator NtrX